MNKIAPGFLDHYLAKTGFKSQQTNEPKNPDQPDNLFSPLPGDFGAHGSFDERARKFSFELWLAENRALWLSIILFLILVTLGAAIFYKSHHHL